MSNEILEKNNWIPIQQEEKREKDQEGVEDEAEMNQITIISNILPQCSVEEVNPKI